MRHSVIFEGKKLYRKKLKIAVGTSLTALCQYQQGKGVDQRVDRRQITFPEATENHQDKSATTSMVAQTLSLQTCDSPTMALSWRVMNALLAHIDKLKHSDYLFNYRVDSVSIQTDSDFPHFVSLVFF